MCPCAWYPKRSKRTSDSPGIRVTGGSELPYGSWEPKAGPLQMPELLILAEPAPIALPSFLRLNVWLLIQNSLFNIGIDSNTLSSEYVIKSSLEFVMLWFKVFSSCLHDFFCKSTCCLRVHFVNLPHFLCITCRFNNTALWEHTLYGFWVLNFTKPSFGLTSGLLWRCFLWAWLPLPSGGVFLMSPRSGCFRLCHDFTWWFSA